MICLRQTDIKGLIAYRSVTHMGVMIIGVIGRSIVGWQGGFLMMVAHGLVSSCIFMGANLIYKIFSSRRIFFIKGLLSIFPRFSLFWFLCLSANIGVPPSVNLVRELILVSSVLSIAVRLMLPLRLSLFLRAAYRLLLYSSSQIGRLGEFNNFFRFCPLNMLVNMGFHLFPVFFLFFKRRIMLS